MNEIFSMLPKTNEQMIQLIIYAIVIFFIISLMRSLFRIFMPVMVIGLVMVIFLGFSPDDVMNKGKQFIAIGKDFILENVIPFLNEDNGGKDNNLDQIPGNDPSRKNDLINELNKNEGDHNVL